MLLRNDLHGKQQGVKDTSTGTSAKGCSLPLVTENVRGWDSSPAMGSSL
eukprot:CAMPEP_0198216372 /NCGR_PEP_ID=MMETSP1445-20131203/57057_1 /TAXON_ID=36898 /ORGANISM="Pyramimonas sp., Strain CCMP2087" /LENGTH=48 /DNA_ID= /DNA_START= /DNA_END= /DNA_ORIENTATION=